MSVIVKRLKAPSMEVYVKGAPEVMADICDPASCASSSAQCIAEIKTDFAFFPCSPGGLRGPAFVLHQARIPSHCHRRKVYPRLDLAQGAADEEVRVFCCIDGRTMNLG